MWRQLKASGKMCRQAELSGRCHQKNEIGVSTWGSHHTALDEVETGLCGSGDHHVQGQEGAGSCLCNFQQGTVQCLLHHIHRPTFTRENICTTWIEHWYVYQFYPWSDYHVGWPKHRSDFWLGAGKIMHRKIIYKSTHSRHSIPQGVSHIILARIADRKFLFCRLCIFQDVMKSQAVWLKTVVVGHQQLIGEVKSMLTTMAKVTQLWSYSSYAKSWEILLLTWVQLLLTADQTYQLSVIHTFLWCLLFSPPN